MTTESSSMSGSSMRPKPLYYGSLRLQSRYLLSPLAGYTNLPFRRIVRELGGVGLATTDLVNARGLLSGGPRSLELIESCPADRPFAVQIFGTDVRQMCDAARLLESRDVDSVDINMGCPVNRIVAGGAGASMMCHVEPTVRLVEAVVAAVSIPVTVKMRLGWDDTQITAPRFARMFADVGVKAVAIHGRTRAQGFSGSVNPDGIRQVVEAAGDIPVIANGDIRTVEDAARMLEQTGAAGISIGRGALANPWIFRQLVEWETTGRAGPAGTFDDRMELMKRQFAYLCEQRGEEKAVVQFRKMAHWYLKGMRVRAQLRHSVQLVSSIAEFNVAMDAVAAEGPVDGCRDGELTGLHVSVPSGPNAHW